MKTTLTMNLTSQSIQKTIQKLQKIENRTFENIKSATKDLMNITYDTLNKLFQENNLSEHIGNVSKELIDNGYGFKISTNDFIIIFNEYGTGVVGQGTHPKPNNYQYNIPSDSKDEFGRWVYKNKYGEFKTTSGMEAKHIFYDIQELLDKYAKEFYSTAINLAIKDEQYQSFRNSLK